MSFVDEETLMKVVGLMGEEAVQVASALRDVSETTDEEIATRTEMRLNSVRKALYQLYDHSLVGLRRSRDEATGWFVFHWRLQPDQVAGFILNQKRHVLEKLETRLEYEKKHDFYHCSTEGCRRVPFEEAVELIFSCPSCDKPLMHIENGQIVEALAKKIGQLREELSE